MKNQNEQAEDLKVDSSERHTGESFTLYHYQHSKFFPQILEFYIAGNLQDYPTKQKTELKIEELLYFGVFF